VAVLSVFYLNLTRNG